MRKGEYKPRVIRGRVKVPFTTWEEYREKYKGQGFTVNDFKAMQKADQYFNGVELYLSSWAYDHHECWHLWNWEAAVDTIDHEEARRAAERQKRQLQAQKRQGTKKKYRPKPKHRR